MKIVLCVKGRERFFSEKKLVDMITRLEELEELFANTKDLSKDDSDEDDFDEDDSDENDFDEDDFDEDDSDEDDFDEDDSDEDDFDEDDSDEDDSDEDDSDEDDSDEDDSDEDDFDETFKIPENFEISETFTEGELYKIDLMKIIENQCLFIFDDIDIFDYDNSPKCINSDIMYLKQLIYNVISEINHNLDHYLDNYGKEFYYLLPKKEWIYKDYDSLAIKEIMKFPEELGGSPSEEEIEYLFIAQLIINEEASFKQLCSGSNLLRTGHLFFYDFSVLMFKDTVIHSLKHIRARSELKSSDNLVPAVIFLQSDISD